MSPQTPLGQLIQSFFLDHLTAVKGLRPASVRTAPSTSAASGTTSDAMIASRATFAPESRRNASHDARHERGVSLSRASSGISRSHTM